MNGQLSIFDVRSEGKIKPYEYSFKRYIGQRVFLSCDIKGAIIDIQPYYTEVLGDDGKLYAGSPSTCFPEEEE